MLLAPVIKQIQSEFFGGLEVAVGTADASLESLLVQLTDIDCSASALIPELRAISESEAVTLISVTLHKGMAYSNEYMPLERATALATKFVETLGPKAQFYSTTCVPADSHQSIGSWYYIVSTHTFESVVYCKGERESAFFLVTDED